MLKISYLIICHNEVEHLKKLINILSSKNTFFFIHIDRKLIIDEDLFFNSLKNKKHIYFLEPRIKVNWGGFNLVEITLELLKLCINTVKCSYINLISGQDFPIKSNQFIQEFFKKNYPNQFIDCFKLPNDDCWKGYFNNTRFERYWHIDEFGFNKSKTLVDNQIKHKILKPPLMGIKLYGGSQWFTITQECAEFIIYYIKKNPKYNEYFKYSLAADEVFFNTIIMNSPFKNNIINNNQRKIEWSEEYPKIFTKNDFKELIASNCLWARKFDSSKDLEITLLLENHLSKKINKSIS